MRCTLGLLGTLAALPLAAQQTHVVQPGQCIQDAIDAASPGDTVLVRGSCGFSFETLRIRQGLRLIAPDGRLTVGRIFVQDLPAGQTVVIDHLELRDAGLSVLRCEGQVLAQRLDIRPRPSLGFRLPTAVHVLESRLLSLTDCEVRGNDAVFARGSSIILQNCRIVGQNGNCFGSAGIFPAAPGVTGIDTRMQISDCTVTGGNGDYPAFTTCPPAPAILLEGGSLQLSAARLTSGLGRGEPTPPPVLGTGTVLWSSDDADCDPLPASLNCRSALVPHLLAGAAVQGQPFAVELFAPPSTGVCLFLSAPGAEFRSPWGSIWLDLGSTRELFVGSIPASGVIGATLPAVPAEIPPGSEFLLQAGAFDGEEVGISAPWLLAVQGAPVPLEDRPASAPAAATTQR